MEEIERLGRYLDHLKYLDKGYVDYHQYQLDQIAKDQDKLSDFSENLEDRVEKTEQDLGFKHYFPLPKSKKDKELDYDEYKYLDEELTNFNKSFQNKFGKSTERGFD